MFTKFKPTRAAERHDDIKILCDFDALLTTSVGFKFQDKHYKLENVDVENYMKITVAYRELMIMLEDRSKGTVVDTFHVYKTYYNLIHPLCPDFAYEDLQKLPFVMLNKLIQLILAQIAGDPEIFSTSTEKKNLLNQIPA